MIHSLVLRFVPKYIPSQLTPRLVVEEGVFMNIQDVSDALIEGIDCN